MDPHSHSLDIKPVVNRYGHGMLFALEQDVENGSDSGQSEATVLLQRTGDDAVEAAPTKVQFIRIGEELPNASMRVTGLMDAGRTIQRYISESVVARPEEGIESDVLTSGAQSPRAQILKMLSDCAQTECCVVLTALVKDRLSVVNGCAMPSNEIQRHKFKLEGLLLQAKRNARLCGMILFYEYQNWLISLISLVGIDRDAAIEQAIFWDGFTLCRQMMDMLLLSQLDEDVLSLKGSDANCFLQLLHQTLDGLGPFESKAFQDCVASRRHRTSRLMLKLAHGSGVIPSFLFIQGVQIPGLQHAVGMGSYADIFLGSYNGQRVAVKRLRLRSSDSHDLYAMHQRLCREALPWRQLRHPNILPFFGFAADNKNPEYSLCMISPFISNGDILSYINAQDAPISEVLAMSLEIAEGVAYLHGEDLVHGDLRAVNILVGDRGEVQISDFGLASFLAMETLHGTSCMTGNPRWMAPELLKPSNDMPRRTYASDIYSVGCLYYELFTRGPPFAETKMDSAVLLSVLKGMHPQRPQHLATGKKSRQIPDAAWKLMRKCWHGRAEARPRAAELIALLRSALFAESDATEKILPSANQPEVSYKRMLPTDKSTSDRVNSESGTRVSTSSQYPSTSSSHLSTSSSYQSAYSSFRSGVTSYASASDSLTSLHGLLSLAANFGNIDKSTQLQDRTNIESTQDDLEEVYAILNAHAVYDSASISKHGTTEEPFKALLSVIQEEEEVDAAV